MCLFRRSRLKGLPSCSESQVAPITPSQRPCATRARTAWRLAVALAGPLSPVPCLSCGATAPSLSFLPSRLVCSEVLTCLPFPTAGPGTSPQRLPPSRLLSDPPFQVLPSGWNVLRFSLTWTHLPQPFSSLSSKSEFSSCIGGI